MFSPARTRSHTARTPRSSPEISHMNMTFTTCSYLMHQNQAVLPQGSRGRRCQQSTLPPFKELEARGEFLPEPEALSHGRQCTPNAATSLISRNERSASSSLRRWPMPLACGLDKAQPQDERSLPESKGKNARLTSESHIFRRVASSERTSSRADEPEDGRPPGDIRSMIRWQLAKDTDPPPKVPPNKRFREAKRV